MTEHHESVTNTPPEETATGTAAGGHDLHHPTPAEVAEAVAASEEMNTADEEYATEIAALQAASTPDDIPATDSPATDIEPVAATDA
ncbi:MAG: hypothetical protein ABJA16_09530, partial [Nakamurella sp.]